MIDLRRIHPLFLCLALAGCTSDVLRAPSLEDNKLYTACTGLLSHTYAVIQAHQTSLSAPLKQRLTSLLIAAEIDGQLKHYPACVNKLERAQLFLKQAKLELAETTAPPIRAPHTRH